MKFNLVILVLAIAFLFTGNGNAQTNLAFGKRATQSSNYARNSGLAFRAVDGNTDGRWSSRSVTHTRGGGTVHPWWEVDLGAVYRIRNVRIWNRTDCCMNRLSNFRIMVRSATNTGWGLFTNRNHIYQTGERYPLSFRGNTRARYVRIQVINRSGILSLAEVQIFGNRRIRPGTSTAVYEQRCYDQAQNRVAWTRQGSRNWIPANLRNLCRGTRNPTALLSCFTRHINANWTWGNAMNACKLSYNARPPNNCRAPQTRRAGYYWNTTECRWVRISRTPVLRAPALFSPANGAVVNAFPRRATLRWGNVPGAAAYHVVVQSYINGRWTSFASRRVSANRFNITFGSGLSGRWRVWAIGRNNATGPSSPWRTFRFKALVRLAPPRLISPANGSVLRANPRRLTLQWARVPSATGYYVEVQSNARGRWTSITSRNVSTNRINITFNGDHRGRWSVIAIGRNGVFGRSSVWRTFEFRAPLRLVAPIQISPRAGARFAGNGAVRFSWRRVSGAIRYIVETQVYRRRWITHRAVSATGSSIQIPFPNGVSGRWRVGSIGPNNVNGRKSPWRNFMPTARRVVLRAPVQRSPANGAQWTIRAPATGSATFVWNRVPGAIRYIVEVQINRRPKRQRRWVSHSSRSVTGSSVRMPFPTKSIGRWRVGAIGPSNVIGPKSGWRTFKINFKLFE